MERLIEDIVLKALDIIQIAALRLGPSTSVNLCE
jgi:hypothetical protein